MWFWDRKKLSCKKSMILNDVTCPRKSIWDANLSRRFIMLFITRFTSSSLNTLLLMWYTFRFWKYRISGFCRYHQALCSAILSFINMGNLTRIELIFYHIYATVLNQQRICEYIFFQRRRGHLMCLKLHFFVFVSLIVIKDKVPSMFVPKHLELCVYVK